MWCKVQGGAWCTVGVSCDCGEGMGTSHGGGSACRLWPHGAESRWQGVMQSTCGGHGRWESSVPLWHEDQPWWGHHPHTGCSHVVWDVALGFGTEHVGGGAWPWGMARGVSAVQQVPTGCSCVARGTAPGCGEGHGGLVCG